MKKLLLAATVLASSFAFAQTSFGAKAGYDLSNMKFKDAYSNELKFDSKSYFYIGGFVEHKFNEKFALQGELVYTEIGGSIKMELTDIVGTEIIDAGKVTYKSKYPQLQIPISAKYYFVPNFNILGGMNFGINLNPTVKTDFTINGSNGGKQENVKTLNMFPFVGAEYLFTKNFSVDARYNFGAFNINESGIDGRISFLQIGFGYRFK